MQRVLIVVSIALAATLPWTLETLAMITSNTRDREVILEHIHGIFRAYADQPAMTLVALVGSSGYLELAIVEESAAAMLGIAVENTLTR